MGGLLVSCTGKLGMFQVLVMINKMIMTMHGLVGGGGEMVVDP